MGTRNDRPPGNFFSSNTVDEPQMLGTSQMLSPHSHTHRAHFHSQTHAIIYHTYRQMILLIQIKQKKKKQLKGGRHSRAVSRHSLSSHGGVTITHSYSFTSRSFGCCAPFPEFPSTSSWAAWSPSASC
uniref:(northern house mosquito) hypothetical protein n=1 Tax=Culex pipiens TaxID=7175 RepID=A0A8D8CMJ8_CULPI